MAIFIDLKVAKNGKRTYLSLTWQDGEGVETDNPVPQEENLVSVQVASKYRHQPAKDEP